MSPPEIPRLRARGRWPPPERPRVALVGSRRPTPYGEAVAEQLGLELARAGVVVVSGLALGVDAAAHRGALNAGGVTVAVMGTGVDLIYPAAHTVLAEAILAGGGALVSQFPDGTEPRRQNFPARNHTIAALSAVVVVVALLAGHLEFGERLQLGVFAFQFEDVLPGFGALGDSHAAHDRPVRVCREPAQDDLLRVQLRDDILVGGEARAYEAQGAAGGHLGGVDGDLRDLERVRRATLLRVGGRRPNQRCGDEHGS